MQNWNWDQYSWLSEMAIYALKSGNVQWYDIIYQLLLWVCLLNLFNFFKGGIGSSSGTGIGGEDGRGSSSIDVNKAMGVGAGLGGRSVLNVHGEASGKLHDLTPKNCRQITKWSCWKSLSNLSNQSGLVILKKTLAGHMCRLLTNPTIVLKVS